MLTICKSLFTTALLSLGSMAFGQTAMSGTPTAPVPSGPVWKKQIARVVDMGKNVDTVSRRVKDVSSDYSLMEMFVNLAKAGKIPAYSNYDRGFPTKLSVPDITKIINNLTTKRDTTLVIDPVTGKQSTKVSTREFSFDLIHKYRVLEEWSCYAGNAKTEVQIVAIAPVRDIFNDDGQFRGVQALFWLKYTDIAAILARYDQYHPTNTLMGKVWDDYFATDPAQK